MKKLLIVYLLVPVLVHSQTHSHEIQKFLAKNPPPNGVLFADTLYMDRTEIANIHWLEYLYWLRRDSSDLVSNQAFPYVHDLQWSQIPIDSVNARKHYAEGNYLYDINFRNHPVVGITKEQALHYCQWRSNIVTYHANKKLAEKKQDFRVKYTFRLPTEKEWEKAAFGTLDSVQYPYGLLFPLIPKDSKRAKQFKKGKTSSSDALFPAFNCFEAESKEAWSRGETLASVYAHETNKLGMNGMIGNVAEMVSEEGIAKGGSWLHEKDAGRIKQRQYYGCPAEWVGFRCVSKVEIFEMNDNTVANNAVNKRDKDTCAFVKNRERSDTLKTFSRILSTFKILNNDLFSFYIDDMLIASTDTISKKITFKGKNAHKEEHCLKVEAPGINYDSVSILWVYTTGPAMRYDLQKRKENNEFKIGKLKEMQQYDAVVINLFSHIPFTNKFKRYVIARRL